MKSGDMTAWIPVAVLLLLCASLPVAPVSAADPVPGLRNPSIRILVDQSKAVPGPGSFGWGMSVFRVASDPELSLATLDARLRAALQAGFTRKGFTYVEDGPDYLVSYALAADAEIDEAELNREYGDFLQMPEAGGTEAANLHYKRGVLIVDLVDRKARHLLWRGAILAEIDMTWPEARKQERCDAAVAHLMTFFPRPPAEAVQEAPASQAGAVAAGPAGPR